MKQSLVTPLPLKGADGPKSDRDNDGDNCNVSRSGGGGVGGGGDGQSTINTDADDEASIATRPPPSTLSDSMAAALQANQHLVDVAQATQNSERDAVGAFQVHGPNNRNYNNNNYNREEEEENSSTDRRSRVINDFRGLLWSGGRDRQAVNNFVNTLDHAQFSNENLPPNIDIIAEATLVVQEDDGDGDEEEANRGGGDVSATTASTTAPDAACVHRSPSSNDVNSSSQQSTDPTTAGNDEPVHAQKMDSMSIYACGRYAHFERWHFLLLAIAAVVVIAVPTTVAMLMSNKNKKKNENHQEVAVHDTTHLTREQIEQVMVPLVSSPSSLQIQGSPQSRAIDWLVDGGGAEIITGPSAEYVEWRLTQRYILAVFYYSTNGEQWENQFGYLEKTKHECDWGGINNGWESLVCSPDKEVTTINLWQNNLRGNIPQELAGLNLTTIDFLENNLNGTVPQEIYTLKDLNYLNLGYNDLTGTVASELGDLNKLSYLMIDYNELTGTIPPELGKLTQLSGWLSLEGNKLHGTVPESFAQITNATWIYLNGNNLVGSVEFMCDALKPKEAPGSINENSLSPLSELYVDINEVECSCCACCEFV